ncbi:MAG: DUF4375 domain-containing protein [Chloroflexota bacterium]
MDKQLTISQIFEIDNPENFIINLFHYLTIKSNAGESFTESERLSFLLLSFEPTIAINGFIDLFHQAYTFDECRIVESGLKTLGLIKLAELFSEAKQIYLRHKLNITDEEYKELEPFGFDKKESKRLDEIEKLVWERESELYQIGLKVFLFAKENHKQFI